MSWYTAPSARKFADQFASDWPRRGSKDGSVGDTAHNARVSDHNPDYKNGGVVRAVDVDIKGRDKAAMIAAAISDERTRYLISDGRIWQNPAVYPRAGGWQTYRGSDGHYGHVHLSVRHAKKYENDTSPWGNTPTPPKEDTLSAAEVKEIKDYINQRIAVEIFQNGTAYEKSFEAVQRGAAYLAGVPVGQPLVDADGNNATLSGVRRAQTVVFNDVRWGHQQDRAIAESLTKTLEDNGVDAAVIEKAVSDALADVSITLTAQK